MSDIERKKNELYVGRDILNMLCNLEKKNRKMKQIKLVMMVDLIIEYVGIYRISIYIHNIDIDKKNDK